MGEKAEVRGMGSIAALQERALDLINSRPSGVFQSDLRRLLEIDSSKCSKVVSRLQSSGQISRERVPASSTYLIKPAIAPAISQDGKSVPDVKLAASRIEYAQKDTNASTLKKSRLPDKTDKNIESNINNQIDRDDRDNSGRLRTMIDDHIKRLLESRIGQINDRFAGSVAMDLASPADRRINNEINKICSDNIDGHIPDNFDHNRNYDYGQNYNCNHIYGYNPPIEEIDQKPDSKNDSIMEKEAKAGCHPISYFDCCQEDDDQEFITQIDGYFDSPKPDSRSHIDSYLTEIFLLYLTRATSH